MRRLAIIACVALAGCQTATWVRPGSGEAELALERDRCTIESFRVIPQAVAHRTVGGYSTPTRIFCHGEGDAALCETEEGYVSPPTVEAYDLNEDLRERHVAACLRQRGWRLVTPDGRPVG